MTVSASGNKITDRPLHGGEPLLHERELQSAVVRVRGVFDENCQENAYRSDYLAGASQCPVPSHRKHEANGSDTGEGREGPPRTKTISRDIEDSFKGHNHGQMWVSLAARVLTDPGSPARG